MANAEWRAGAMKASSPQWAELSRLNGAIAAGHDADAAHAQAEHDAANQARQGATKSPTDQTDDVDGAPEGFYDPPAKPSDYRLNTQRAQELGLQTNPTQEFEILQAFYTAGVSPHVASLLYTAAIGAATSGLTPDLAPGQREFSPAAQETQYRQSAHALHKAWGSSYEANLAAANAEARRVFEALPKSLTKDASFADYCRSSGIANSKQVVLALFAQAKARQKTGA